MPKFKCRDIGMDCGFKAKARTEGELMKHIAAHAKEVHNLDPVPDDILKKVKKAIK